MRYLLLKGKKLKFISDLNIIDKLAQKYFTAQIKQKKIFENIGKEKDLHVVENKAENLSIVRVKQDNLNRNRNRKQ